MIQAHLAPFMEPHTVDASESRSFTLSLFTSARDNVPRQVAVSWSDLVDALSSFDVRALKDGPAWSPAIFDGTRALSNVRALSCLVFDLDEESPTVDHLEELQRWAHHWHSTHSGGWRLTLPLSRDVSPAEHSQLWDSCAVAFGLKPDAACRDASRLFYLPSCPPNVEPQHATHTGPHLPPGIYIGEQRSTPSGITVPAEQPVSRNESKSTETIPKNFSASGLDLGTMLAQLEGGGQATADARKLLTLAFNPPPGQRNERLHKALASLARFVNEETLEPLLSLVGRNFGTSMDLAGESADEWNAAARSSLTRMLLAEERKRAMLTAMKGAIDGLEPPTPLSSYGGSVAAVDLKKTEKGGIKASVYNLEQILERDPRFKDKLRINELTRAVEVDEGCPLYGQPAGYLDVALQSWLGGSNFDMNVDRGTAAAALLMVANRHPYNPVKDWLEGLAWDGTPRLHEFFKRWCHATGNDDYLAKCAQKFFTSCVARAYEPGCKVDTMLILQGAQGVGKSRLIRLLAGDGRWATSLKLDVHNKDSVQVATSHWLVELAELATMRRTDLESFKAFITSQVDNIRMPYERTNQNYARRCVFVGTTNDSEFLEDDTNRRFWPVSVAEIEYDEIRELIPQLWGEAVALYKAGMTWWLDAADRGFFESESGVYSREGYADLMAARISDWYVKKAQPRPAVLFTRDIAQYVFQVGIEAQLNERGLFVRIGRALRKLGCRRERHTLGDETDQVRRWCFVVPERLREAKRLEIVPNPNGIYEEIGAAK